MKSILKRMSSAMIAICVGLIPTMSSAAFNSYVDIEVAGYTGDTTLINFPVLVTLTPTSIVGFSYEAIQADGKDIAFTSVDGAITYKHEIDTWNPNGTSHIWVVVPELTNGTKLRMNLGNSEITETPSYAVDGTTWNSAGYTAVWHLGDPDPTSSDVVGVSYDSSSNNLHATNGVESVLVSDGAIGGARFIGSEAKSGGLIVTNWTDIAFKNVFTVSLWVKHTISGLYYDTMISTKADITTKTDGWGFGTGASSYGRFYTYGAGNLRFEPSAPTPGKLTGGDWQKIDMVYNAKQRIIYTNGVYAASTSSTSQATENTNSTFLAIGSGVHGGNTWRGNIDEVRFAYDVIRSADWIKAEYDNVRNASFLKYGEVISSIPSLIVSGDLGNVGIPSPAYGTLIDISPNDTFIASVDDMVTMENGVERYVNLGYSHYKITNVETGEKELVQSGTENTFEYTHNFNDELVWHFKKQYYVKTSVVCGDGTITNFDGWYDDGTELSFVATPSTGEWVSHIFDAPAGVETTATSFTFTVDKSYDIRVAFATEGVDASVRYVSVEGSDENDGYTLATAKASIANSIESIEAIGYTSGTVYMDKGRYEQTDMVSITNAIKVIGLTGKAEDVVVENVASSRVFFLDNKGSSLANIVVSGGIRTDAYNGESSMGGNICIHTRGGSVSNCVVRNGYANVRYSRGIGIYMNSDNAYVTRCVITNNNSNVLYDTDQSGIGVHVQKGLIENSLIAYNKATNRANSTELRDFCSSAVAVYDGKMINCTIVGNVGRRAGGVNVIRSNGSVINCVSVGNELLVKTDIVKQGIDFHGKIDSFKNCVGSTLTLVAEGEDAIQFTDPNSTLVADYTSLFVNYAQGDFRPNAGSILVDAGSTTDLPVSILDLKGKERIIGNAIDIGAYEISLNSTLIIIK